MQIGKFEANRKLSAFQEMQTVAGCLPFARWLTRAWPVAHCKNRLLGEATKPKARTGALTFPAHGSLRSLPRGESLPAWFRTRAA